MIAPTPECCRKIVPAPNLLQQSGILLLFETVVQQPLGRALDAGRWTLNSAENLPESAFNHEITA